MKKVLLVLASLLAANFALGSVIAIIDSGTDMEHEFIAPNAWTNYVEIPNNNRDEDGNGYQDDVYGWNFAENNNQVIDYSYGWTYNEDVARFFEIQAKNFYGTLTRDDVVWYNSKIQEAEFIRRLNIYGNYMHGTHVAGIAIRDNDKAEALAVKLLPTSTNAYLQNFSVETPVDTLRVNGPIEKVVKNLLNGLAGEQAKQMTDICYYVAGHKADVANGSFGTSMALAMNLMKAVADYLKIKMTDEQAMMYAEYYINRLVELGKDYVAKAPNTLFVFAAGNDGTNNDLLPASPTNIQAENVISVAAMFEDSRLARFSNFGKKMVDVAAPGVAIYSSSPDNKYIRVSGTSQAAPYVANVAGRVKDANPDLTPADIKKIILKTVDVKSFLVGKVATDGMVNDKRAVATAELSLRMSVDEAIAMTKGRYFGTSEKSFPGARDMVLEPYVVPLPSILR